MDKPKVQTLNIKVNKNPVVALTFSKGKYTLDDIRKKLNDYQQKYQRKGFDGRITANALFPTKDGKNSKWRTLVSFQEIKGEDIVIDENEFFEDYYGRSNLLELPDKFSLFQILVTQNSKPRGGNDKYNDCLYNVLVSVIPDIIKSVFPTPESLKTYCGLERDDKVPLNKIAIIEDRLHNYKINVIGQHKYKSIKPAKFTITLVLQYEHYYLRIENKVRGIAHEEKQPLVFKYNSENPKLVRVYNGTGFKTITFDKLAEYRQKPISSPFVLVKHTEGSMKDTYVKFITEADLLKEHTKGIYNLYKTGTYLKASVNRFYELNPTVIAEEIEEEEAEWIRKGNNGSLMWAKKGYKGEGYCYDINSEFPAILASQKFLIPIKAGVFKKMTKEEFDNLTYFEYGIYRAKVYNSDYRLFRNKNNNYYTHFDLTRAKELNYEIELIVDGHNNLLSYADKNSKINGNIIFEEFVKELYKLKAEFHDIRNIFKKPLNIIWGALCERIQFKKMHSVDEVCDVDGEVISLTPIGSYDDPQHYISRTHKVGEVFNTPFARLGPFLLARARAMISRIIEPHINTIVRVHTDGFISTKELTFSRTNKKTIDSVKIGTHLGDLKYEGYCNSLHIMNVNRIIDTHTNTKAQFKV